MPWNNIVLILVGSVVVALVIIALVVDTLDKRNWIETYRKLNAGLMIELAHAEKERDAMRKQRDEAQRIAVEFDSRVRQLNRQMEELLTDPRARDAFAHQQIRAAKLLSE